ncbi:phage protein, HK97 gp10 family [Anaerovibrio lipolyticus DSM 3074]|uniref:Phage protein, HK97 gp10 family n=1 Tax=Anaerovibrio lipolyticus DSM 3074 TaxID=1120997 RepID=A0A1M6G7V3_9FIRM|nr:HK97-gp10 family putative phage morphogenesis protein [Anaerovibrio lipolyticus]SHJ06041.1 phage protein, HK97 gp10 family [Anaerovibrio lipolyticus DSM 3074]
MAKQKFLDNTTLKLISEKVSEKTKEALKESAELLVNEAKSRCPVDSGRLRDSIHAVKRKGGVKYQVVADAKDDQGRYYGRIVEYSPKINRPFMYPAMDSLREQIKDKLINAVRDGLKR